MRHIFQNTRRIRMIKSKPPNAVFQPSFTASTISPGTSETLVSLKYGVGSEGGFRLRMKSAQRRGRDVKERSRALAKPISLPLPDVITGIEGVTSPIITGWWIKPLPERIPGARSPLVDSSFQLTRRRFFSMPYCSNSDCRDPYLSTLHSILTKFL